MMKKVLHGLLVMGAAAVVSVGALSYDAAAAGVTATNYTVDYANQKIKVSVVDGKTNGNTKLYVAKATVTKKNVKTKNEDGTTDTKEVTTVKNGAATEYDVLAGMTFDLTTFGVTRDTYLSIWGNVTKDPILVKLPAATTKMKAVVDATDATVQINNIVDPKNPVEISGTEFCTTNGVWANYTVAGTKPTTAKTTTTKLTGYADLGATLRFRVKASANAALPKAATKIGTDANGAAVNAYVATGNFASNELKVKIPKTANGPKATIDYNKRTITVPNNSEYRVQAKNATLAKYSTAKVEEGSKAKTVVLNADTLFAGKTTDMELDLRSAATDKKPASKITEYAFSPLGTITGGNGVSTYNPAVQDVTKTTNIIKIGTAVQDIKVTKLTLSSRTMAGTMTITNNSAEAYEFVVEDAQTATKVGALTLPTVTSKVKGKVVAFNSKTGKPGVANIAVKSGQYVYVRKASNTTSKTWSTPYVFYGVVNNTLG